jgi:hypothetical protein
MLSIRKRTTAVVLGTVSISVMGAVSILVAGSRPSVELVSGSGPASVGAEDSSTIVEQTSVEQLLEGIGISPEIHAVQEQAVQTCMELKGFKYAPVPFYPIDLGLTGRYVANNDGIDGEQEISSRDGTGMNEGLKALDDQAREAWGVALFGQVMTTEEVGFGGSLGLPSDGCLAQAQSEVDPLWREREKASFQLSLLMGESLARSEDDLQVQGATTDWLQCMDDSGQSVKSLEEAASLAVSSEAVVSATARCDESTGLSRVWRSADLAAQRQLLKENPAINQAARELVL